MEGVEKKPIEPGMAVRTSAAATANPASEPPMMVKPPCLRVMRGLCCCASCSSIEPEILQALVQLPQSLGVVGDRLTGIGQRAFPLVAIAHPHIGTHQPQPSLDVVAVLLQS